MRKKFKRYKRILGISCILLALVIAYYPVISKADVVSDSGTDGDIAWEIAGDTLTIKAVSGSKGEVKDYGSADAVPWLASASFSGVNTIVIEDGVTKLGQGMFGDSSLLHDGNENFDEVYASAKHIHKLSVAGTVKTVGEFTLCAGPLFFDEIEFCEGVETIERYAHFDFVPHRVLRFPSTIQSIAIDNFFEGSTEASGGVYCDMEIYGYPGTAAEQFAKDINTLKKQDEKSNYPADGHLHWGDISFYSLANSETVTATVEDKRGNKENTAAFDVHVANMSQESKLLVKDSVSMALNNLVTLKSGEVIKTYNLSLVDSSEQKVSDFWYCTVTLPIPSTMDLSKGTVQAIAENTDGTLEKFVTKIVVNNGVECARFTTTHFSEYGLLYTPTSAGGTGDGDDDENDSGGNSDAGDTGNTGDTGGTGNNGGTDNNVEENDGSNNNNQESVDDTSNGDDYVVDSVSRTDDNSSPNGQTVKLSNAKDMPQTGAGGEGRTILSILVFLVGVILFI